jgi:hypothetical protein
MLDVAQVNEIGAQVARQYLPPGSVLDVESREREGPDGEDGLTVLVVLRDDDVKRVTGDQLADMIYQLQRHLQSRGEDRFAAVAWATDADLAREAAERAEEADGDP